MLKRANISLNDIEIKIMRSLHKKYNRKEFQLDYINTNNLIFQQSCRIVALFKDYLVLDDPTEFLRRFYKKEESFPRVKKISTFFETYSKLFPNYMILPESVYLYKNIRKKQKMIDAVNEIKREEEENRKQIRKNKKNANYNYNNMVFTPKIQNSINHYQPSVIYKNFDDDSFDNSISISVVSKKFIPSPEGSFIKDDERNITLLDILSGKETKEITVKPIRNKNESPRHNKQVQKIFTPSGKTLLSISNKSKSQKFISSRKIKSSSHFNVYNNYQNIIISQGNTIININNNYYNNYSNSISKVNQQLKLFSGMLSPQPSSRSNNIYKPSSSIEKKTIHNFKSSKNMLTERTRSSNFLNVADCHTIYKRKNDTLYTQKNNTLVAKIERKGSNPKIATKPHENLLLNSEGYKSQVSLKVNHLLSPKRCSDKSRDKIQSTAMKTKYKAFIQKSKDLAIRNSCDTFISTHKSNKCFHTISSNTTNAISVNKKLKPKKENTTRSTVLSPSVNKSSLKMTETTSPLVRKIKVNRKKYFEKIKNENGTLNTIEYQTYENTINTKFNTIQGNDDK